jgi:hypothetical protein
LNLDREGSMSSGFNYGDSSKPDWTSNIRWRFLRHQAGNDVYRVEWTFRAKQGSGKPETTEVAYDGRSAVRVFSNQWQTISIETGTMKTNSQQPAPADALPRAAER